VKRFLLLLITLTVLCSGAHAANWWDSNPLAETLFVETCDAGNLAGWSGTTAGWTDAANEFEHDGAPNPTGIYKTANFVALDFNLFVRHRSEMKTNFFSQTGSTDSMVEGYFVTTSAATDKISVGVYNGSVNTVLIEKGFVFGPATTFDLNINRNPDGFFELFIDEVSQGLSDWSDTNYISSNFIINYSDTLASLLDDVFLFEIDDLKVGILTVEGFSKKGPFPVFYPIINENLTIDFNVFNSDNNRILVDFNYGIDLNENKNIIVTDLNLTSDVCPDQDWDDVPSTCSIDWNISNVEDGNYFIKSSFSSGIKDVFDFTRTTLKIQNDVNLLIKNPINEETGAVIGDSTTHWIVRISDSGFLTVTDFQIDDNFFTINVTSPDFVTITIDTNATAVYNSRQYAFDFSVPQDAVLQPYLPPVAESILTTVHTLSAENFTPLTGYRIKVFKDLVGGRTLIHDSVTDGKGETTIPFIVADEYEIEVYAPGGSFVTLKTYTATSTTNNLYFYITQGGLIKISEFENITVNFLPALKSSNTTDLNIQIDINSLTNSIAAIKVVMTNNEVTFYDSGLDEGAPNDGNTYVFNVNEQFPTYDTNYTAIFTVTVVLDNGDVVVFNDTYLLRPGNEGMFLLTEGMRSDFGCKTFSLQPTCVPLLFISFMIVAIVTAGFAVNFTKNGIGMIIMALILTSVFVYLTWVPIWIFFIMIVAGIGGALMVARMD